MAGLLRQIKPSRSDKPYISIGPHTFNKPSRFKNKNRTGLIVFYLTTCLLSMPLSATNAELQGVTDELSRQQQSLLGRQKQLNRLQKNLKNYELSISTINRDIRHNKQQLDKIKKKLSQLQKEQKSLTARNEKQQAKLAELVRAYYLTNQHKGLVNLLKGEGQPDRDRISRYFKSLANERTQTIRQIRTTSKALANKKLQLQQQTHAQTKLLADNKAKYAQLQIKQKNRHQVMKKIQGNIANDRNYIKELEQNEKRLKREIAKAKQVQKQKQAKKPTKVVLNGLSAHRGKLAWPVQGQVIHDYASQQTGQIKWKGVVIKTQYEQPVQAVLSGKVVFAEWLRGYGLVMLVDHGRGDMTLYGYNQTLLKQEGDLVRTGEIIALAGDSGGQTQSSVYFEIRRNSRTQDPLKWLK